MAITLATGAVKTGLVEVEQGDRDQRQLDGEAGRDEAQNEARRARDAALVAAGEPGLDAGIFMQGDDRDDRREAHLEARPDQRFGPQDEHDQRADRDEAQRQRLAADRDAGEHEQGGDAGAHRRHLRAGQ